MKKFLLLFVLVLVLSSFQAFALSWGEQRSIAREIGRKFDFDGSFRFAYYEEKVDSLNNVVYFADYKSSNRDCKDSVITFYKNSLSLSKNKFRCLVLHELGHCEDDNVEFTETNKNGLTLLNDFFADSFMIDNNNTCVRFYP